MDIPLMGFASFAEEKWLLIFRKFRMTIWQVIFELPEPLEVYVSCLWLFVPRAVCAQKKPRNKQTNKKHYRSCVGSIHTVCAPTAGTVTIKSVKQWNSLKIAPSSSLLSGSEFWTAVPHKRAVAACLEIPSVFLMVRCNQADCLFKGTAEYRGGN